MPNPGGSNQFGQSSSVFQKEPARGSTQQLDALKRQAEAAGQRTAASALYTPRRSQRKAVRGDAGQVVAAQPVTEARMPEEAPAPIPEPSHDSYLFFLWAEIAAHPEASPLVSEVFESARARVGR